METVNFGQIRSWLLRFFAISMLFTMASCVHFGTELALQGNPSGHIPSLRHNYDLLDRNGGKLRVLMVHGMANHPFGDESQFKTRFGTTSNTYKALQAVLLEEERSGSSSLSKRRGELMAAICEAQFNDFIKHVAGDLGCKEDMNRIPRDLKIFCANDNGPRRVLGYNMVRRFTSTSKKDGRIIEFHLCSWAMPACIHKERVYTEVDDRSHPGIKSTKFVRWAHMGNDALKGGLVNWGLTDAAVYVGNEQAAFQWVIAQCLAKSVEGLRAEKDCLAVVTASLGSTIAVDALSRLLTRTLKPVGGSFSWYSQRDRENLVQLLAGCPGKETGICIERPVPIYMFANQYQLIKYAEAQNTSHRPGKSEITARANPAKQLQEAIVSGRVLGTDDRGSVDPVLKRAIEKGHFQAQVIAFTDPDDLLSHPFAGVVDDASRKDRMKIGAVNVYVRNPKLVWGFVLAGPLSAHTAHADNRAVRKRIMEGATKERIKQDSGKL